MSGKHAEEGDRERDRILPISIGTRRRVYAISRVKLRIREHVHVHTLKAS